MGRAKQKKKRRDEAEADVREPVDDTGADAAPEVKLTGLRKVFFENIEPLLVAVVLALIIRCFVVEAFQIPTGSMAPTLLGRHSTVTCDNCGQRLTVGSGRREWARCWNCGYEQRYNLSGHLGGDRILVNKNIRLWQKPRRWSVVVFKHKAPGQIQKNYIKRLVGLGGEILSIGRGDVYINGKLAPKPEGVQEGIWIPAYDMAHGGRGLHRRFDWSFFPPDSFEFSRETVTLRGKGEASLGPVMSMYTYDSSSGMGSPSAEHHMVGDLRFRFAIQGRGRLVARIDENERKHRVEMTLNEKGQIVTLTLVPDPGDPVYCDLAKECPVANRISFWNWDGRLALFLNNRKVAEAVVPQTEQREREAPYGGVALSYDGEFTLTGMRVDRDVYYVANFDPELEAKMDALGRIGVEIPDAHLFFMGDNVPLSQDSRKVQMGFVPEERLVGQAFVTWWPPWRWKLTR